MKIDVIFSEFGLWDMLDDWLALVNMACCMANKLQYIWIVFEIIINKFCKANIIKSCHALLSMILLSHDKIWFNIA